MTDRDKVFAGSIPELYDTWLVPLIFEAFALDLAHRVAATRPARVLETAAGSGVVTRALAPLLDPSVRYVVSDLNPPMLDRAASRQGPDERITWRQADALDLPFPKNSFDAVCCQFGAMFFPDRIAGYREARRVLDSGGFFFFNVWDRIEDNDFALVVTDAVGTLFPDDPPRFLARTPHGYHDVALIEADLRAAGFAAFELARSKSKAMLRPPAMSPMPTARAPLCATRSWPATPPPWKRPPPAPRRRSPEPLAKGRSPGRSRAHVITARA